MAEVMTGQLRRVLGVVFGIAAIIGGTIGQGILRAPGQVAAGVPDATIIMAAWIVVGLFSFVDAMSTVELAVAIRRTGGPYTFAERAFGPFVGLAVGLTDWVSNVAAIGYISVVLGEYLHRMGLATAVPVGALAALLPIAIGGIQLTGTRAAGRSQELGSAVKMLLFTMLIVALLFGPRGVPVVHAAPPVAVSILGVVAALRAVIGTYNGWNGAAYYCEETVDPRRAITRATFSGIAMVTALYVLANLAFLRQVAPAAMAGDTLVAASATAGLFGPRADFYVTALSTISLVTIVNSSLMMYTRVLWGVARDRRVPVLNAVAANGTPRTALLATVAASALMATVGLFDVLLALSTALYAGMCASVNLAALVLRRREPALERPYRMPLFPAPALLALAVNTALATAFTIESPRSAGAGFALMLAVTAIVQVAVGRSGRAATA
ncbi:APC family permease [Sphingomonas sp.]|uniref:APC family permease n=1 Tax=Sphingomonas sp. TaxID=28214 RepID=UPI003CC69D44